MRILSFLNTLLDAVLPRRERALRTAARSPGDFSLSPESHALLDKEITTLMHYSDGAAEDVIRALKYDRSKDAARICAALLADYLREEIASVRAFSPRQILLIPLPLHAARERERGFNQMHAVLEVLPGEFQDGTLARVVPDILVRTRNTPPQTRLSRRERLANVAGAFEVPRPELLECMHVFLIDDVATTGATLVSAAKPFEEVDIPVSLIALARA